MLHQQNCNLESKGWRWRQRLPSLLEWQKPVVLPEGTCTLWFCSCCSKGCAKKGSRRLCSSPAMRRAEELQLVLQKGRAHLGEISIVVIPLTFTSWNCRGWQLFARWLGPIILGNMKVPRPARGMGREETSGAKTGTLQSLLRGAGRMSAPFPNPSTFCHAGALLAALRLSCNCICGMKSMLGDVDKA